MPLLARYDLEAARSWSRDSLAGRVASMWRYHELMPLLGDEQPVSLGEGWTPMIPAPRLGSELGLSQLFIKDESQNPTHSFKARGMAVAVSMAKELGATKLAVPSAGNAGGALAAYAARAGLEAHVFMPRDTPRACVVECAAGLGARSGHQHADRRGRETTHHQPRRQGAADAPGRDRLDRQPIVGGRERASQPRLLAEGERNRQQHSGKGDTPPGR